MTLMKSWFIVGPSLDILIRLDIEDGEVSREVFVENYVQHIEGRYGKRGNTMCITVPVEERDKRFILDSGSGHDLISSTRISRMDLPTYDDKVVNFHTANGVNMFDQTFKYQVRGIQRTSRSSHPGRHAFCDLNGQAVR